MDKKKFAVFDIDGTYFRFQLYWQTALALAEEGMMPPDVSKLALTLYDKWKNRTHDKAFEDFDRQSVTKINECLHEINPSDFDRIMKKHITSKLDHINLYPKKLKEKLQSEGYVIIAISGSRKEEVELFAKHHGFDDWIGQEWHRSKDGKRFTGDISHTHKDKDKLLEVFVKKHNLTYTDSYAIGDSAGDISLLEVVDNPIVFNPNHSLLDHAKERGWKIVIERKSISYTLEQGSDGTYQLA